MTTSEEATLRRIRARAILIGTLSSAVAFAIRWQSGLSLTIGAAVVIFSLLVLEKLTERLVPPQAKTGIRALLPLLLVTAASVLLLGAVVLRWKGFDPVAGAIGLSAVVAAVVLEVLGGGGGGQR
ncbi:MAG TPA: hypothetical protein VGL03_10000 [Thermoanaerobaculia bacterium]